MTRVPNNIFGVTSIPLVRYELLDLFHSFLSSDHLILSLHVFAMEGRSSPLYNSQRARQLSIIKRRTAIYHGLRQRLQHEGRPSLLLVCAIAIASAVEKRFGNLDAAETHRQTLMRCFVQGKLFSTVSGPSLLRTYVVCTLFGLGTPDYALDPQLPTRVARWREQLERFQSWAIGSRRPCPSAPDTGLLHTSSDTDTNQPYSFDFELPLQKSYLAVFFTVAKALMLLEQHAYARYTLLNELTKTCALNAASGDPTYSNMAIFPPFLLLFLTTQHIVREHAPEVVREIDAEEVLEFVGLTLMLAPVHKNRILDAMSSWLIGPTMRDLSILAEDNLEMMASEMLNAGNVIGWRDPV
jgi:hypothetical protein